MLEASTWSCVSRVIRLVISHWFPFAPKSSRKVIGLALLLISTNKVGTLILTDSGTWAENASSAHLPAVAFHLYWHLQTSCELISQVREMSGRRNWNSDFRPHLEIRGTPSYGEKLSQSKEKVIGGKSQYDIGWQLWIERVWSLSFFSSSLFDIDFISFAIATLQPHPPAHTESIS